MNPKASVVGGFILGGFALIVVSILFFGSRHLFSRTSRVVVFFDESVAGLDIGAPVTFHGAVIGTVQSVAVHFKTDTLTIRIPVYLKLQSNKIIWEGKPLAGTQEDYDRLIRVGLRAQLTEQSFVTGQLRVDLSFRPATPVHLTGGDADVPEIPAISSELSELRTKLTTLPLSQLVDAALQTLHSLSGLADHLNTKVDPLIGNLIGTSTSADQALRTANQAIGQLKTQISATILDLQSVLGNANRQLDHRGTELSRLLTDTNRAAAQATLLLNSLNELTDRHAQARDDLEATIRDLSATASALRGFAETLERNPSALILGRGSR